MLTILIINISVLDMGEKESDPHPIPKAAVSPVAEEDLEDSLESINITRKIGSRYRRERRRHNSDSDDDEDNDPGEKSSSRQSDEVEKQVPDEKASKPKPLPPPSAAPPRRARDGLQIIEQQSSSSQTRVSVDDFIRNRSSNNHPHHDHQIDSADSKQVDQDDSDGEVDFKEELKKYSQQSNGHKKPPRAPTSTKSPYESLISSPSLNAATHTQISTGKVRTPPRQPADPGTRVDADFVNEDWDVESPSPAKRRGGKEKEKEEVESKRGGSGVQSDPNWLEEDFDS